MNRGVGGVFGTQFPKSKVCSLVFQAVECGAPRVSSLLSIDLRPWASDGYVVLAALLIGDLWQVWDLVYLI